MAFHGMLMTVQPFFITSGPKSVRGTSTTDSSIAPASSSVVNPNAGEIPLT